MLKLTRRFVLTAVAGFAALSLADLGAAEAAPEVGKPAPTFTGTNLEGQEIALADLKGKTVVLEWTNHQCPYVEKHYGTGNMQALQKAATGKGVTWISIVSSAPGLQGHVSAAEARALTAERDAAPSEVVLDPDGTIGRLYGARTTPHMFVINPDGTLVYAGGIDDKPTARWSSVENANNYVRMALADLEAGRSVGTPTARPYGCSVKYTH
ncbi:redoxin domain-containing protein [Marinibaculum pumilum]|uniref:Redoxin domain-containing protein n=1 Tax=Marinibaculum pumilum TaxID=1766165 RepID=A0ABV7L398_9PROT